MRGALMHVLRDIKLSAVCPVLRATAGLSASFDMTATPQTRTSYKAFSCRDSRPQVPCKALFRHNNSLSFHSSFLTDAKRPDVAGTFAAMAECRRRGIVSREGCGRKKIRLSPTAASLLFLAWGGAVRIRRLLAERCGVRMPETAAERMARCCPPVLGFGFCM